MLKSRFSFILFLSFIGSFAQSADFVGFIKLENNTFINYHLDLNIDGERVSGYSITDQNGEHETKSTIEGYYDPKGKVISFKEVDIVYTKSPVDQFDFCHVYFRGDYNKNRLTGEFQAYYKDNEPCISGQLMLSKAEKVERRQESVTRKVERRLARKEMTDTITEKLKAMKFTEKRGLQHNENVNVIWEKSYLKITVWDAGTVDNDTILLGFNKEVPRQIIPKKKPVELEYYLSGEVNTFTLQAVSEGSEPPNTTKIKLSDGEGKTIDLFSDLKVNEKARLTVYREIPNKE